MELKTHYNYYYTTVIKPIDSCFNLDTMYKPNSDYLLKTRVELAN